MRTYNLDSDTEFIWSEVRGMITVSTLDNISNPTVKDGNWKHRVACIGPGEIYDGLKIWGKKIHGSALTKLSCKIGDAYVLVNREGYCFLSTHAITGASFHAHFFRLNDLFEWSEYGVKPVFRTVWYRSGLENARVIMEVNIGNNQDTGLSLGLGPSLSQEDEDEDEDDEPDYDVNEVVDERQVELPGETFVLSPEGRQDYFAKLEESEKLPEFTPLDEEVGKKYPKRVVVHTLDGVFDKDTWWGVRAKMGKEKCMIGYYGGCHTRIRMDTGEAYFLPINKGQALTASTQFFLARMRNAGVTCLAFKYSDKEGREAVVSEEANEAESDVEVEDTDDDDDDLQRDEDDDPLIPRWISMEDDEEDSEVEVKVEETDDDDVEDEDDDDDPLIPKWVF